MTTRVLERQIELVHGRQPVPAAHPSLLLYLLFVCRFARVWFGTEPSGAVTVSKHVDVNVFHEFLRITYPSGRQQTATVGDEPQHLPRFPLRVVDIACVWERRVNQNAGRVFV